MNGMLKEIGAEIVTKGLMKAGDTITMFAGKKRANEIVKSTMWEILTIFEIEDGTRTEIGFLSLARKHFATFEPVARAAIAEVDAQRVSKERRIDIELDVRPAPVAEPAPSAAAPTTEPAKPSRSGGTCSRSDCWACSLTRALLAIGAGAKL